MMKRGLLERVQMDFPDLRFVSGRKFAWRPPRTVVLGPEEEHDSLLLMHELGHASLGHQSYVLDVERLKIEVEAWGKAQVLAERYEIEWDEDVAQDELDSYREWLHRRSKCRRCGLTCYQTKDRKYHCPRCENLMLRVD